MNNQTKRIPIACILKINGKFVDPPYRLTKGKHSHVSPATITKSTIVGLCIQIHHYVRELALTTREQGRNGAVYVKLYQCNVFKNKSTIDQRVSLPPSSDRTPLTAAGNKAASRQHRGEDLIHPREKTMIELRLR